MSWESVSMETMWREEKKKRRVLTIVKVFAALSAAVLQRAEPCSDVVCPPAAEQAVYVVELQTNLREVWSCIIIRITITEKAPVGVFSWLNAAATFIFKNLLRHYAIQELTVNRHESGKDH